MTSSADWSGLASLDGPELKIRVWEALRNASLLVNSRRPDDPAVLETVPRLASLIESRSELKSFIDPFNSLARSTGLWNYIDRLNADTSESIISEAATISELDNIVLHKEQLEILDVLLTGQNVVLSAPTSFGKSLLIDALISSQRYGRIVVVLPTIALLDEFRRRFQSRFGDKFEIIMHSSERPRGEKVIYLGTQERLIARNDLTKIDLTVVDEFYKLDPSRRDERNVTLNAAVHKLLHRSKQFFFLGPNIDGVSVGSDARWSFNFIKTKFSTVAVDTLDLRAVGFKQDRLMDEIAKESNWPVLVFASAPDKANALATDAAERMAVSETGWKFAEWLRENVGSKWPLCTAVEFGFALHHGRIPRAVASHMVRLFNSMELPVLFCTSTLIEGVNTAAKTVIVYDKTINRSNYDFFTFSNIRGRAGRLGKHYVGQVILFNEPPETDTTSIAPTLFSEEADAPDDYIVQLDEEYTSVEQDERIAEIRELLALDAAGLRVASSLGLDSAYEIKKRVVASLKKSRLLVWSNYPNKHQLRELVSLFTEVRGYNQYGAASVKHLIFLLHALRYASTMKLFLRNHDFNFRSHIRYYENIFKFLRACEYGLPQVFAIVEAFVQAEGFDVDYGPYIRNLHHWFRPEILKNLDEEGVPIQVSERYYRGGDTKDSLAARLRAAALNEDKNLTPFERDWLKAALA